MVEMAEQGGGHGVPRRMRARGASLEELRALRDRVRWALSRSGLSAREIERRAGFYVGFICKSFTDRGERVGLGPLRRLAAVLGVAPGWLAFGVGPVCWVVRHDHEELYLGEDQSADLLGPGWFGKSLVKSFADPRSAREARLGGTGVVVSVWRAEKTQEAGGGLQVRPGCAQERVTDPLAEGLSLRG